jgi:putative hydrolase of the HAD superfamily
MPVRAVLFDLGGTLIQTSLNTFETFQKILENQGVNVSTAEIERAFAAAEEELGDEFKQKIGKVSPSRIYEIWDSHVLKALEIEDDGSLGRIIDEKWLETTNITVFPDVQPTLAFLERNRIKTGIISNAYEEEIYQICDMVDLRRACFNIIVGADTAKKIKPDPEIFKYAARMLKISPEEAIFVGNDIEKDYKGAKNAGMNPFLIARSDAAVPKSIHCIRSLLFVADLLG